MQKNLDKLYSPNVLAFPDFEVTISESRKFWLVTDASADRLGVVLEQQQPDGSVRPLRYLSRATLDNERKWSVSEPECTAIPFKVETDYQSLQNFASLSDKSNRVHRWFTS